MFMLVHSRERVCIIGSSVGGAICVCRPDVASVRSKSFNPAAFVEDEFLWRLQRSTLVHRDCSHPEDRRVPRRHGADRVEGFSCRSYTVACAHTRAYHARCTTRSSFFFLNSMVRWHRGPVMSRDSRRVRRSLSCLRDIIVDYLLPCVRRKLISSTIAHATQFTLYLFDIFY